MAAVLQKSADTSSGSKDAGVPENSTAAAATDAGGAGGNVAGEEQEADGETRQSKIFVLGFLGAISRSRQGIVARNVCLLSSPDGGSESMQIDRSSEATPSISEADMEDDGDMEASDEEDDPVVTHPPLHLAAVSLERGNMMGCMSRSGSF